MIGVIRCSSTGCSCRGNVGISLLETSMRGLLVGVAIAALLYVVTGGHLILLPLFFVLPLGGLVAHRRSRRRW
jgi:hypothetical protein